MVERGSAGVESMWEHCEGKLEEGLLAGDSGGYVENALEMGISFHTTLVWGNGRRTGLPGI
jgi:hypothetical protein